MALTLSVALEKSSRLGILNQSVASRTRMCMLRASHVETDPIEDQLYVTTQDIVLELLSLARILAELRT